MKTEWKSESESRSVCLLLCNLTDYTVHGILQARILEWAAFFSSRGSSQPKDQTQSSCIAGGFFTSWATGKPKLPLWSCFLVQQNNPVKTYNRSQVSCAQNLQLVPYFSHFSNIAYIALYDLQLNLLPAPCSSWPSTVPWTQLRMLASSIFSLLFIQISSWLAHCLFHNFIYTLPSHWALHYTRASLVVQTVKNLPVMQKTQVWWLGQENPLEKEWLLTPVFLPGEFHGQRSVVCYSP